MVSLFTDVTIVPVVGDSFLFQIEIVFTTSPIIWFAFTLLFSEMRYDLGFIIPLSYNDFNSCLTMLQSKMSQVFKSLQAISAKDILYGWLTSSLFLTVRFHIEYSTNKSFFYSIQIGSV